MTKKKEQPTVTEKDTKLIGGDALSGADKDRQAIEDLSTEGNGECFDELEEEEDESDEEGESTDLADVAGDDAGTEALEANAERRESDADQETNLRNEYKCLLDRLRVFKEFTESPDFWRIYGYINEELLEHSKSVMDVKDAKGFNVCHAVHPVLSKLRDSIAEPVDRYMDWLKGLDGELWSQEFADAPKFKWDAYHGQVIEITETNQTEDMNSHESTEQQPPEQDGEIRDQDGTIADAADGAEAPDDPES